MPDDVATVVERHVRVGYVSIPMGIRFLDNAPGGGHVLTTNLLVRDPTLTQVKQRFENAPVGVFFRSNA